MARGEETKEIQNSYKKINKMEIVNPSLSTITNIIKFS